MPKPVTYYATGNNIDTLVDCFGSCLEQLTIDDKKALRLILSQYTYASTPSDDYTLEDAMEDALAGLIIESQDIPLSVSILKGITHDDAESLLEAICAQIR